MGAMPIRLEPASRGYLDGRKTAVPIVEMYYVRSPADPLEQRQSGVVKKREPLVILGVAIDGVAVKERGCIDKKSR